MNNLTLQKVLGMVFPIERVDLFWMFYFYSKYGYVLSINAITG